MFGLLAISMSNLINTHIVSQICHYALLHVILNNNNNNNNKHTHTHKHIHTKNNEHFGNTDLLMTHLSMTRSGQILNIKLFVICIHQLESVTFRYRIILKLEVLDRDSLKYNTDLYWFNTFITFKIGSREMITIKAIFCIFYGHSEYAAL